MTRRIHIALPFIYIGVVVSLATEVNHVCFWPLPSNPLPLNFYLFIFQKTTFRLLKFVHTCFKSVILPSSGACLVTNSTHRSTHYLLHCNPGSCGGRFGLEGIFWHTTIPDSSRTATSSNAHSMRTRCLFEMRIPPQITTQHGTAKWQFNS
jgi:hypothetical protein